MRRALAVALLSASCREPPPPRLAARPRPPATPPEPAVAQPAHPDPVAMIPGHPAGDAGIPPAPEGGPVIAWDLVPFDDGLGRDDAAWLVLAERPGGDAPPRDLVNVGARGACREVAPPMLRDGASRLVSALRAVHCELPEPADFSLARAEGGAWEVLRSGCARPSRACPAGRGPESVVGRVAVPAEGLLARLPGAFARREQPAPMPPPAEAVAPRAARLRWVLAPAVRDGTGVEARNLALVVEATASRRVDFGAVTSCRAATAAERATAEFARGALAALVCETPDEGARRLSVTRDGDVLRVHAKAESSPGLAVTRRVGLEPGSAVTAAPLPR